MKLNQANIGFLIGATGAAGFIAWMTTTSPPAPVVFFALILIGWPLLGCAYYQGAIDVLEREIGKIRAERTSAEEADHA